jgi:hypothetical protein
MSDAGFRLSRLVVTGVGLFDAEVSFHEGFNVITGPSNTGKSYIVECIDYVFGAEDVPGEGINESKGYDTAFLELISSNGATITLERSLLGGDVNMYDSSYVGLSGKIARPLSVETQTKKAETLSSFLLNLIGISGIKVRSNASGEKANLTFRTISHLFIVDETSIIAKKHSPVHLMSGYAKTPSERAFNYLLTGNDDHSIVAIPDAKHRQANTEGKKELYDELIEALEKKVAGVDLDQVQKQLTSLDNTIKAAVESLEAKTSTIHQYQVARQTAFSSQHDADSRLIVIGELLSRFTLLKEHYNSDLQRLEFISEGDHYFDQLVAVRCPVCGTALDEHATKKMCDENGKAIDAIQEACRVEVRKIQAHIGDLEQTIAGLQAERAGLVATSASSRSDLSQFDKLLADELRPTFATEKAHLDNLMLRRRESADVEGLFASLEIYKTARLALDAKAKGSSKNKFAATSISATRGLCDTIQALLRTWTFIGPTAVVDFHETKMDISVAGKPRQSNGKGLRGFLHGAFTIGLMHYCRANKLPHPGFVVLDSPITSYREGKEEEAEDEAPTDVQAAFWDNLSQWSGDEQIILIENKEPTESARKLGNYLHFFGNKSLTGRKGFFPEKVAG